MVPAGLPRRSKDEVLFNGNFRQEHLMSRSVKAVIAVIAVLGTWQLGVGANGIPVPKTSAAAPRTPEERAVVEYNRGLDSRNRGAKAEAQAAKSSKDSDRVKHEKKALEEYRRALKSFEEAATLNPELPHAWNGVGFAQRKLGDPAKALASYDRALLLAPNFPDAIEYRGEAYLALNRIDDAKQAYLALFAIDRKQAELLMKAMSGWVAQRKVTPAGADPAAVSELEKWISERSVIAQQTRLMSRDAVYRPW
jgi:tetratricopeptide (TPR) repeat protein